jgi:hypothetical protein
MWSVVFLEPHTQLAVGDARNMTLSWRRRLASIIGRGRGVNSMMVALLIAGIGLLLAGLSAIGFGFQINEFSLGNALLIAGTVAACTGMLLMGLWIAVREITHRLGAGVSAARAGMPPEPAVAGAAVHGELASSAEPRSPETGGSAEPPPPLPPPDGAPAAPPPVEPEPAAKPRRNLLFSSSSRRERERAQSREGQPSMPDAPPAPVAAPPVPEPREAAPVTFDDAWPRPDRARPDAPALRRNERTPPTFTETGGADPYPPAARSEEPPAVTVLKSGVVDGMAYSLYSDGSIEAQMPEGMMRFASIDELRAHLDQRP